MKALSLFPRCGSLIVLCGIALLASVHAEAQLLRCSELKITPPQPNAAAGPQNPAVLQTQWFYGPIEPNAAAPSGTPSVAYFYLLRQGPMLQTEQLLPSPASVQRAYVDSEPAIVTSSELAVLGLAGNSLYFIVAFSKLEAAELKRLKDLWPDPNGLTAAERPPMGKESQLDCAKYCSASCPSQCPRDKCKPCPTNPDKPVPIDARARAAASRWQVCGTGPLLFLKVTQSPH